MSAKPPIQTSSPYSPNNLDHTSRATHVYIKKAKPLSLESKFEGPYEILSRPSRSTIVVKIGSHVDGTPRVLSMNWNSCKIAHLRDDAKSGSRPSLGRPARPPPSTVDNQLNPEPPSIDDAVKPVVTRPADDNKQTRGKIQMSRQVRSTRNPSPAYVH